MYPEDKLVIIDLAPVGRSSVRWRSMRPGCVMFLASCGQARREFPGW